MEGIQNSEGNGIPKSIPIPSLADILKDVNDGPYSMSDEIDISFEGVDGTVDLDFLVRSISARNMASSLDMSALSLPKKRRTPSVTSADKENLPGSNQIQVSEGSVVTKGIFSSRASPLQSISDAKPRHRSQRSISKPLSDPSRHRSKKLQPLVQQQSSRPSAPHSRARSSSKFESGAPLKKYQMKILVVGNCKCGKSSIIQRYVNQEFNDVYKTTIGADYVQKIVRRDNAKLRIQLWDIAGQDRFVRMTRPYFRNAKGAVVVCDVTRPQTLEACRIWKEDLDDKLPGMPVVLLANKCDLLDGGSQAFSLGLKVQKMATEMGFIGCYVTSAKMDCNLNEAMDMLMDKMLLQARKEEKEGVKEVGFKLSAAAFNEENKANSNNCC